MISSHTVGEWLLEFPDQSRAEAVRSAESLQRFAFAERFAY